MLLNRLTKKHKKIPLCIKGFDKTVKDAAAAYWMADFMELL